MSLQQVVICQNFTADLIKAIGSQSEKDIFILFDENTKKYCSPLIFQQDILAKAKIHTIPAGDENKTVETIVSVWQFLSENGATRKSLLINIGGGMLTDLGGFAASTFKRGMRYINIPTTLLGAVDAAVGGKTGINFNGLKNEIGVINPAETVLIETAFFASLDHKNLLSGMAEMIKHALISSTENWKEIIRFDMDKFDLEELKPILAKSISIKERIVEQDPTEQNIRKALNFGHTVGHAFESLSHERNEGVLHGYAVAWGMICELYLSHKLLGFPKDTLLQAVSIIKNAYGSFFISCKEYEHLFELMTHDKKNDSKEINFTLLAGIGDIHINQHADKKLIFEALDFYREG
jgi:3-dehydroquinate synthase